MSGNCARCARALEVGDLVIQVRVVTRSWDDPYQVSTDRSPEGLAHLTCPTKEES